MPSAADTDGFRGTKWQMKFSYHIHTAVSWGSSVDHSLTSLSCFPFGTQVKALLEEMLERLMDEFNIAELMAKVEERTPYAVVAFQECERMNILTSEIKRSLKELDLGLKVRAWDA